MLNPMATEGDKVWKDDVQLVNGDAKFVPSEVTFLYRDGGLIWFRTEHGQKFGWYASQFFHTKEECETECDLLNQEADGIITERKQKEIDDNRAVAERMRQGGVFRIFG